MTIKIKANTDWHCPKIGNVSETKVHSFFDFSQYSFHLSTVQLWLPLTQLRRYQILLSLSEGYFRFVRLLQETFDRSYSLDLECSADLAADRPVIQSLRPEIDSPLWASNPQSLPLIRLVNKAKVIN